ncbi:MAG: hypothetical protein ACOY31_09365 [Bacillota bacterium]
MKISPGIGKKLFSYGKFFLVPPVCLIMLTVAVAGTASKNNVALAAENQPFYMDVYQEIQTWLEGTQEEPFYREVPAGTYSMEISGSTFIIKE